MKQRSIDLNQWDGGISSGGLTCCAITSASNSVFNNIETNVVCGYIHMIHIYITIFRHLDGSSGKIEIIFLFTVVSGGQNSMWYIVYVRNICGFAMYQCERTYALESELYSNLQPY